MAERHTSEERAKRARRISRTRAKVRGSATRPRLAVFRSGKHIYAQLIDDDRGRTLVAASDLELKTGTLPTPKAPLTAKARLAYAVGQRIAKKAKAKGVERVVFDRHGYTYHGRVAALAAGAREAGLVF